MGYLVIARGGERDGEVISVQDEPDPTTSFWYPAKGALTGHPLQRYRVTQRFEDLPSGDRAQVVEFDG